MTLRNRISTTHFDHVTNVVVIGARLLLAAALCFSTSTARAQTGPVVTFIGITDALDRPVEPSGFTESGAPIYQRTSGTGFSLVIEARPGPSQQAVGTDTSNSVPGDPAARPDLQILSDSALGNGSAAVCDPSGGVPAVAGSDYPLTNEVTDALNDFACRFTAITDSIDSCAQVGGGNYDYVAANSTVQFCSQPVTAAFAFALGPGTISVRVRDAAGNVGPVVHMVIQVGPVAPTSTPTPTSATAPLTPTRTATTTLTRTATATLPASTSTPTRTSSTTGTPSSIPTLTPSATASMSIAATSTMTPTQTATSSASPPRTATPSPAPVGCDVDADGAVTETDLRALIAALFTSTPEEIYDLNGDERLSAPDVTALFSGCTDRL